MPRAYAPPEEKRVCRCCAGEQEKRRDATPWPRLPTFASRSPPLLSPSFPGTARIPCPSCTGSGVLPPGGYRATNPVIMPKIVGTTWTAAERTLGRTHFRCADKRRVAATPEESEQEDGVVEAAPPPSASKAWFVLMVSACDPSIRLWVEARALKDRARWTPGWVTVADVAARRAEDEAAAEGEGGKRKRRPRGVGPRSGAACKGCAGSGKVDCPLCSRAGELIEV